VGEALGDGLGQGGPLRQQAGQLQHSGAAVERARLVQHRVVKGVEVGELALALGGVARGLFGGTGSQLLGPLQKALRPYCRRLQRVDPADQPRQQPGGVAADLMAAQRQLVDAVEQHRQPLGGAEALQEGVEARLGGVLAQQPDRGHAVRMGGQLLEGLVGRALGAGPQVRGAGVRAAERQGALSLACEARQPLRQGLRPARAGDARDEQGSLGVVDRPPLLIARIGVGEIG
jgi:hypothetical protein